MCYCVKVTRFLYLSLLICKLGKVRLSEFNELTRVKC